MKAKLTCWAALLGCILLVGRAPTQEIPHVEFFNKLRQNNLPELALEYLQKMKADGTLPKEMVKDFPLESARLRMEIADSTTDARKRDKLREEARKFYADYANDKANAGTAGAAEAGFEVARVVSANAKSALRRALLEEEANRNAALKAARAQLIEAEAQLKKATGRIQEIIVLDPNPKLVQTMLQAQLEQALILLDQTQTYGFQGDEVLTRADKGKQALEQLTKLAAQDESSPTCWQAKAWIVRANGELDQFPDGEKAFKTYFSTAKGPLVPPAKRLAHYFLVKLMNRNSQTLPGDVVKTAEEWLVTYRPFRDTPEGQEVRFLLAENYKKQGEEIGEKNKLEGDKLYRRAEQVFHSLSQSDGDYASAARRQRVALLVKLRPELTKGSLEKLTSFEDFFLRAQLEMAQLSSDYADLQEKLKKTPDQIPGEYAKKEQERQKTAVAALDKGMALINDQVPESDIVDAKYLFIYLLMTQQQAAKAAEQGDEVAHKYPKSSRAGTCGAYALHAYTQAIEQARQQGMKTADLEEKMQKLAEHLVATWPNDLPAAAARHQLGLVAYRTSKFADAVEQLEKISSAYESYNQTQYLLAMAALQAEKANMPVPKGKDPWKEVATKAYSRIQAPTGPQAKDFDANRFYVYAKIEEAKILFANKKYAEMDKLLDEMNKQINKLEPKDRDAMQAAVNPILEPLTVYSKYGRAFNLMNSDKPDRYKVLLTMLEDGLIDKLANAQKVAVEIDKKMQTPNLELANAQMRLLAIQEKLEKNPKDKDALAAKAATEAIVARATAELQRLTNERREKVVELDPKLTQALFGFALTANLMEGKTDRAIQLLGYIQQSSGGLENQGVILAKVVGDIVNLVNEYKAKGNKAGYEKTKKQFSAFLEVLAKQPVQKMKPEMIRFLGMSYSALDLHKQAIDLLTKIPEPTNDAAYLAELADLRKKLDTAEAEAIRDPAKRAEMEKIKGDIAATERRAQTFYGIIQLMIAREYRLMKDYPKSWDLLTTIQKTEFGKRSLDLRKERIQWMMDKGIYGTAASEWSALMKDVRETRVEEYNDALYNYIFCLCKYAETNTKLRADQKASYIERAAKMIVTVEKNDATMGGLRDRYLELINTNKQGLKAAYEQQKKEADKAAEGNQ